MNMHCVMLRWGWQVSLVILTETWRPIVPGDAHCTLLDSWVRHSVASPQSSSTFSNCVLVLLQSGFHAYWLKSLCHIILPRNTSTAPQQKQHYHRQPCKQYHSVTVEAEDTMAHHVTWCNHHYETKHLDEMTISTLMITACVKAQITQWVNLFTQLRRHRLHLT